MSDELKTALTAVRKAAIVCRRVQANLVTADTLAKKDRSPVTVADYASQAIVCSILQGRYPGVRVVGEEDSAELRAPDATTVRTSVVEHVSDVLDEALDDDQVCALIDHGGWTPDGSADRYWTLDPIDGTKGFLRGQQYAIALALIDHGKVVLGVLGCPNMATGDGDGIGCLFSAEDGTATVAPLDGGAPAPVAVSTVSTVGGATFCESVESGHSSHGDAERVAEMLGITSSPFRIDSQCKYAAVARGDADIYLRLPTRPGYREKIWDHAAGLAVVEAAGGKVSDIHGKPLDFSRGRTLDLNRGVISTNGTFHDEVVRAVTAVCGDRD